MQNLRSIYADSPTCRYIQHDAQGSTRTVLVSKHPHKNSKTNMTSSRRSIRRGEQYYLRFNIDCSSNMPAITEFGNTVGKRSDHMQG